VIELNDRFLRQRGLIDQNRVEQLNVLVSGSPEAVSDLVVLLSQLGIGQGSGSISLIKPSKSPKSIFWDLSFPKIESWEDWKNADSPRRKIVSVSEISSLSKFDYHLSLNSSEAFTNVNLYGYATGPRGKISRSFLGGFSEKNLHVLSPSMRIVVASTMLQQMLQDIDGLSRMKISGAWFTISCRVESTDLEEVRKYVSGVDGTLVDVQLTSDGNATLARYRPRNQPKLNVFDFLFQTKVISQFELSVSEDVGLISWDEPAHAYDETWQLNTTGIVVLGAGGLGSWCAPLLVGKLNNGTLHIVDGDPEIEVHNLNRQVLYNLKHLGLEKASIASSRLQKLNPNINVKPYCEYLTANNLYQIVEDDDDFDELGLGPSMLFEALKSSELYLACLDNMVARTNLNQAAIKNEALMVNGATEAMHGVVETFGKHGCMVCRYGEVSARSTEVISCTEEGIRPIASIVTSTAWVGSMMAIMAMVNLRDDHRMENLRSTWFEGQIEYHMPSQPPWYEEHCKYHI